MRRDPNRSRSRGHEQVAAARSIDPPVKKVFNCIADDSALLAGAKKSTRDGIRKWIANGQIRLFVPLYTLNQAALLKEGSGRISTDAEDALVWLDDATSTYPQLVTLQGGFEKFDTWAEVEKFALPKPLFSEGDVDWDETEENTGDLSQTTESKLSLREAHLSTSSAETDGSRSASASSAHTNRSSVSAVSPPESPAKSIPRTRMRAQKQTVKSSLPDGSSSGVPTHLRPLFNYILWRIHQELDPVAALESFIFLTDDPTKTKLAQRFGIRTKSLSDIRFVVAREEREFKNRQLVQRREIENNAAKPRPTSRGASASMTAPETEEDVRPELLPVDERPPVNGLADDDDDEDEILLKRPPKAPAAMLAQQKSPKPANKVMDPNQFSRNGHTPSRGGQRGGASRGGAPRGRGGATFAAGNAGRGASQPKIDPAVATNGGPIDPNSYTRPPANTNRFRGGRRLWVPT